MHWIMGLHQLVAATTRAMCSQAPSPQKPTTASLSVQPARGGTGGIFRRSSGRPPRSRHRMRTNAGPLGPKLFGPSANTGERWRRMGCPTRHSQYQIVTGAKADRPPYRSPYALPIGGERVLVSPPSRNGPATQSLAAALRTSSRNRASAASPCRCCSSGARSGELPG